MLCVSMYSTHSKVVLYIPFEPKMCSRYGTSCTMFDPILPNKNIHERRESVPGPPEKYP